MNTEVVRPKSLRGHKNQASYVPSIRSRPCHSPPKLARNSGEEFAENSSQGPRATGQPCRIEKLFAIFAFAGSKIGRDILAMMASFGHFEGAINTKPPIIE